MKNKILSFMLSICLILPCMFALSACTKDEGPKETSKIMTVTLNPSIEFVLNEEDEVVSVNAVNDDGNFIVDYATFTGLSAEDAVDLFLQVAKENGFILDNSTEDLKIEISGETAKELYKKVAKSAKDYLESSNIELNMSFEKISKDDIELLVKDCMREMSFIELDKMSEEKLLSLLEKSRRETSELLSQELKDLYYHSRAQEGLDAQCEKVQTLLSAITLPEEYNEIVEEFETAYEVYTTALKTFHTQFETIYMDAESDYQAAMQAYVDAKKALLDARLDDVVDLSSLEETLAEAKDALYGNVEKSIVGAKQTAETALFEYKIALEQAASEMEIALDEVFTSLFGFINLSDIEEHMEDAKEGFKSYFHDKFSTHIENKYWSDLNPNK